MNASFALLAGALLACAVACGDVNAAVDASPTDAPVPDGASDAPTADARPVDAPPADALPVDAPPADAPPNFGVDHAPGEWKSPNNATWDASGGGVLIKTLGLGNRAVLVAGNNLVFSDVPYVVRGQIQLSSGKAGIMALVDSTGRGWILAAEHASGSVTTSVQLCSIPVAQWTETCPVMTSRGFVGGTLHFELRVDPDQISGKVWNASGPEPTMADVTSPVPGAAQPRGIGFYTLQTGTSLDSLIVEKP